MEVKPFRFILIGFILVLFGFVAPFLMVIKVVQPTFFLSFLSFGASVSGLVLGIIGAAYYSRVNRP